MGCSQEVDDSIIDGVLDVNEQTLVGVDAPETTDDSSSTWTLWAWSYEPNGWAPAEQGLQRSVQRPWCHIDPSRPVLQRAGTFSDQPPGTAFWYENSNGLAEIAVNRGRADRELGLAIGTPVEIVE